MVHHYASKPFLYKDSIEKLALEMPPCHRHFGGKESPKSSPARRLRFQVRRIICFYEGSGGQKDGNLSGVWIL
jgi:hypothetical protein